jgi:hypothetical protein
MASLSYSEIYGQRKLDTTHALARLNSYRNPLFPPAWSMPPSPTPLSIAYHAMWDAEAKEHEARTAYMRAIGTQEEHRLYGTWDNLDDVYEDKRETYSTLLEQVHAKAEEEYEAALKAEQTAKEIYEHEMLLLILPQLAPTEVHYKILGPRNKVPTDTWMDAGLYGVSELGLRADIRDVLCQECAKYLEADKTGAVSAKYGDREPAGFYFIAVHKAHACIKAILAESPRVGLWKTTGASAGGAGAGASASAS